MNLSEPKKGFLMSDMIVGACITIAPGAALGENCFPTHSPEKTSRTLKT